LRATTAAALAFAGLLAAGAALYPLAATQTKSGGFAGSPTLDGMVYLRSSHPDDVAAIRWLQENRPGASLVEGVGGSYTDAARFATFAANPALVGWAGHEGQWRGPNPEIGRRQTLARRVYTDANVASWLPELQQLGVRFVVLGDMERQLYQLTGPTAVETGLALEDKDGGTAIYSVPSPSSGES